jgi:SAM-dependent methyltransferase
MGSALQRLGLTRETKGAAKATTQQQQQTADTFGFKWSLTETYRDEANRDFTRQWLLQKYCDNDATLPQRWLSENAPQILLDAGCGAGYSALCLFGDLLKQHDYLGVDISDSVEVGRRAFAEHGYPGEFLQCDLGELPLPKESVDTIFSEGVLHHTDSTGESIQSLSSILKPGGRFLFYVYAKKSAIREFTDDCVREAIAPLENEEAWEALRPITKLGIALGELDQEIEIPEDIELLGIKAGRYNLQRFFYYNVIKAFYREDFSFESMNHINFDWFRPANCHRHTPEEVEAFCAAADLEIERMHVEPAGITVVARKR